MEHSPLSLMALQVNILFRFDDRGRMLCVNEPGEPPAPRFFMGRTHAGNVWRLRHDLPDDLASELERLCRAEPVVHDFTAPLACYEVLLAMLDEYTPLPGASAADTISEEYRGPCYRFPETLAEAAPAVELTPANIHALPPEWAGLGRALSLYAPVAAVLEGGRVVSVCFCSRVGVRACEAGLETDAAYRRRGYGAAATALWARLVRASGRTPLYSTAWENLASQALARCLGLVLYGEDFSLS